MSEQEAISNQEEHKASALPDSPELMDQLRNFVKMSIDHEMKHSMKNSMDYYF